MADFKTKLIMFAGLTTAFAGMAFGQSTANASLSTTQPSLTASTNNIRSEGTTELVGNSTVNITSGTSVATITLTAYIAANGTPLPITSAAPSGVSEITATYPGLAIPINGVVGAGGQGSNSVTFTLPNFGGGSNVNIPVTISNVRVNATVVPASVGAPPVAVTIQVYMTGTNVTPGVSGQVAVAFAQLGLGKVSSSNVITDQLCAAVVSTTTQFTVSVSEGFASAFKTKVDESGSANYGTRLAVTFANVPTNVTLYVPVSVGAANVGGVTAMLNATTSATGAFAIAPTASGTAGLTAVTIANNSGTVYYETVADNAGAIDTFAINVSFVSAAGALTAPTTPVTATVSFAPIGSTTSLPTFVSGASTATVNGSTYIACSTTLLFPYLTNASGFETGIAIANTSVDKLGASGASSVAAQTGTCSLSMFGGATNPAAYVTPSIPAGTTTGFTLTTAAGAGFTGYAIAVCNFQFAHAFSYIVYNFGTTSGTAMGYLAEVITGGRFSVESLNN